MRRRFLQIAVGLAGVLSAPLAAQNPLSPREADSIVRLIQQIPTTPLEVLPVSDCRLDALEKDFAAREATGQPTPAPVSAALRLKRSVIDAMRIHIDSLYYIQALQAVNQAKPDYEAAMQAIEKSLLHNRFYARSVVFKMNYLLKKERNAQACLRYLNRTLQEYSSNPKVRNMAQTTYDTLMLQVERMLADKRCRDALDLYGLIHLYCRESFPLHRLTYKEKLLENRAYQGLYESYMAIAEKVWRQNQDRMVQKYAMMAYDFFKENEAHMNGMNTSLDLLYLLACRYLAYAEEAEDDERDYYLTLVDDIVKKTGLPVQLPVAYDVEQDMNEDWNRFLAAKDIMLSSEIQEETQNVQLAPQQKKPENAPEKPAPQQKPKLIQQKPSGRALAQAQEQYAACVEQAYFLRSKRRFPQALALLDSAARLSSEHNLKPDPDFASAYASTSTAAVEQLVNKAVYNLWTNKESEAEALYAQAAEAFDTYRRQHPEDLSTQMQIQQILSDFSEKKDENACRKLHKEEQDLYGKYYRQLSYGNVESAGAELQNLHNLCAKSQAETFASCPFDTLNLEKAVSVYRDWALYRQTLAQALSVPETDIASFVDAYHRALNLFDSLELARYVPHPVSLFSRLSSNRKYDVLYYWGLLCLARNEKEQAQFILSFLQAQGYRKSGMDKHLRNARKAN